MKRSYLVTALALVATTPAAVHAQFDFGRRADASPWEQFKLDSKARVKLDFREANVDAVLRMLSRASGITIIKDPALTSPITLLSPEPQSLGGAFAMLDTVLDLKNYRLEKSGDFLVIRARAQRGQNGRGNNMTPEQMAAMFGQGGGRGGGGEQTSLLRVYPIKYGNATQVARVINEAFIGSGANQNAAAPPNFGGGNVGGGGNRGGGGNFGGGNRGGGGGNNPFAFNRGGGGGNFGGGNVGGGNFGGFSGRRGAGAAGSTVVRASADDYSNSVIVNAPGREQDQVRDLIDKIDKQTETPQQSRVFNLQFASATELAPVVQNVLTSNAPLGRGGQASQQVPIDQRFQQARRFGNAQAAFGTVVAEPRTNSLVVTATEENLQTADKIIKELDKEVTFASSTFVLSLENARADVITDILNQSFSGRTNNGRTTAFGGQTNTYGNQNNRNNNNRNNNNRTGGFGGGLGGGLGNNRP